MCLFFSSAVFGRGCVSSGRLLSRVDDQFRRKRNHFFPWYGKFRGVGRRIEFVVMLLVRRSQANCLRVHFLLPFFDFGSSPVSRL